MTRSAPARRHILVVDDDPAVLGLMDETLTDRGYAVLLAQSGSAALDVATRTVPDLVLVDAQMPGMTGWDVCALLRRDPGMATTPLIFMTGLTETEHVLRAFEAGAVDYVTKPLALEEVLARIAVHIEAASRIRAAYRALDNAGRFLLAMNDGGEILWTTPQATRLLALLPAGRCATMPKHVADMPPGTVMLRHQVAECEIRLIFVGATGDNERLFRITAQALIPERILQDKLGLSVREAEVLLWISRGKTSRDIADILQVSPRTIDKHMEQIYNKTGFSTRAAAAATASRLLHEG